MENYQKFEGIDYEKKFEENISSMHQLVAKNLDAIIPNTSIDIIDIGGGPGVGAKIIDRLEKTVRLLNIEPSNNIDIIPDVSSVEYATLQLTFKEVVKYQLPWKADLFLMVSAAHEITISNGKSAKENKEIFFQDLKEFVKKNAKPDALLAIGFPNYKIGATEDDILMQREVVSTLMGHSHPPEEFYTAEELIEAFNAEPIVFNQTPMPLTGQTEESTKLMANFMVFKVSEFVLIRLNV